MLRDITLRYGNVLLFALFQALPNCHNVGFCIVFPNTTLWQRLSVHLETSKTLEVCYNVVFNDVTLYYGNVILLTLL